MQSIKLQSRVGHDGRLKLDIPIGLADVELEVLVVVHPVAPAPGTPEERGWSPGFFEQTAGAWAGEPLVRGEQGEYEDREELALRERRADYNIQGDQQ